METAQRPLQPESLIPQIGIEHVHINDEGHNSHFTAVPLGKDPLFEVDGVKALAEIKIQHDPNSKNSAEATYYVVDVSDKGYHRPDDHGGREDVSYLVVTTDFFNGQGGDKDRNNYAAIRNLSGRQDSGRSTIVGGDTDTTRFGTKGSPNSVRVHLNHGSISIGMDKFGDSGFEVAFKRDDKDPAAHIVNYREQKKIGDLPSSKEQEEQRKTVRGRFVASVRNRFDKYKNLDRNAIQDDLVRSDIEEIDDKFGFNIENADKVKSALILIQQQERQMVVAEVTEQLRTNKLHSALGSLASLAAGLVILYADGKLQGSIGNATEDKTGVNSLTAMTEVLGYGASIWFYHKLTDRFTHTKNLLIKGLDKSLPQLPEHDFKADTEQGLIREVAEAHSAFLRKLDDESYNVKQANFLS